MRTFGNILWLVVAGVWLCLGYLLAGLIQCVTIVGIPFGIQSFKLAGYALWPFGRVVVRKPGGDVALSTLGNVLWLLLAGVWLAIGHLVVGVLLCVTVVGIPLGVASFRMGSLALWPFGKMIVPAGQAGGAEVVVGPVPTL